MTFSYHKLWIELFQKHALKTMFFCVKLKCVSVSQQGDIVKNVGVHLFAFYSERNRNISRCTLISNEKLCAELRFEFCALFIWRKLYEFTCYRKKKLSTQWHIHFWNRKTQRMQIWGPCQRWRNASLFIVFLMKQENLTLNWTLITASNGN